MSTINTEDVPRCPVTQKTYPEEPTTEEEENEEEQDTRNSTEQENSQVQEPIHAHVVITFHDRMKRIKLVLFLMYIVGVVTGIPSPLVPALQQTTFGSNMFAYTGYIAAAKGFVAACYTPIFGALSDIRGRKWALAITMICSVFPFAVYVASGNYIAYAVMDALFGLYAATLSLSMAAITDRIPRQCGMRTESFAMCVCTFFLGMGCGPFVGVFVSTPVAFLCSMIIQFLGALYVIFAFPNDDPTQLSQESSGLLSANGTTTTIERCPFGPHNTSSSRSVASSNGSNGTATVPVETASPVHAEGDPNAPEMKTKFAEIAKQETLIIRVISLLGTCSNLRIIAATIFFNFLCVQLIEQLLLQYLQVNLGFNDSDQAIVVAVMAVGALISLAFIVPAIKKRYGVLRTLQIALIGNFFESFLIAFVRTKWQGMTVPLLGIVSMAAYPCASALAAASVTDDVAGSAQGVAAGGRMIAEGVSPLAFGLLLQATQDTVFPGAPFVVGAGCVMISFAISFFYTFKTAV